MNSPAWWREAATSLVSDIKRKVFGVRNIVLKEPINYAEVPKNEAEEGNTSRVVIVDVNINKDGIVDNNNPSGVAGKLAPAALTTPAFTSNHDISEGKNTGLVYGLICGDLFQCITDNLLMFKLHIVDGKRKKKRMLPWWGSRPPDNGQPQP